MQEQIKPESDKTNMTYQYLCELAVISKRRGTTHAFIDVALQFAGEAVVAVQQLQRENVEVKQENGTLHMLCEDRFNEIAELRAELAAAKQRLAEAEKDAARYRFLRKEHEGVEELDFDTDGLPIPVAVTALAFTVFCPVSGALEPISCMQGCLDSVIDAARTAQAVENQNG